MFGPKDRGSSIIFGVKAAIQLLMYVVLWRPIFFLNSRKTFVNGTLVAMDIYTCTFPLRIQEKGEVTGYEAVDVKFTMNGFGGLENTKVKRPSDPVSLLDGSVGKMHIYDELVL